MLCICNCLSHSAGKQREVQGLLLHNFAGWHFWRFDISAQLGDSARCLHYSLHMDGVDVNHRYWLSTS